MPEGYSAQDPIFQKREGQLAVDVAETPEEVIIRTAIAGVTEDDLTINVTDDVVTIRGTREVRPLPHTATLHFSECFWGPFSRTIILPCHVQGEKADATLERGILTLILPKAFERRRVPIKTVV
jgi:HSP20 family protein